MPRISSSRWLLLTLELLLSGCGVIGSDLFANGRTSPCPPLREYSNQEQDRAARELDLIPDEWMTQRLIDDYRVLRDQVRACR